jgi:D-serine deaminase-like pyridoxal phosphate-dependent protein
LRALVEANRRAAVVAMVDDGAQVDALAGVAKSSRPSPDGAKKGDGVRVPVAIDVDMSWRPLGGAAHLGVRRSPLHEASAVVELAQKIAAASSLRFAGVMGYEAQIAGLPDAAPFSAWQNPVKRAIKAASRPAVLKRRAEVVAALDAAGLRAEIVNGGGTGSVDWTSQEAALTEVTVGSGFVDSTLFDHYDGLALKPALFFALQVTRRPAPGVVTCHGGGYISSGPPGPDRQPTPVWPAGAKLLGAEGCGEVQTPVTFGGGQAPQIGGTVVFRPAKAGELAEHFDEYLLLRGGRVEARAKTYRGLGRRFLG